MIGLPTTLDAPAVDRPPPRAWSPRATSARGAVSDRGRGPPVHLLERPLVEGTQPGFEVDHGGTRNRRAARPNSGTVWVSPSTQHRVGFCAASSSYAWVSSAPTRAASSAGRSQRMSGSSVRSAKKSSARGGIVVLTGRERVRTSCPRARSAVTTGASLTTSGRVPKGTSDPHDGARPTSPMISGSAGSSSRRAGTSAGSGRINDPKRPADELADEIGARGERQRESAREAGVHLDDVDVRRRRSRSPGGWPRPVGRPRPACRRATSIDAVVLERPALRADAGRGSRAASGAPRPASRPCRSVRRSTVNSRPVTRVCTIGSGVRRHAQPSSSGSSTA